MRLLTAVVPVAVVAASPVMAYDPERSERPGLGVSGDNTLRLLARGGGVTSNDRDASNRSAMVGGCTTQLGTATTFDGNAGSDTKPPRSAFVAIVCCECCDPQRFTND